MLYTDNLGEVQESSSGEERSIEPKHKDTDWWKLMKGKDMVQYEEWNLLVESHRGEEKKAHDAASKVREAENRQG